MIWGGAATGLAALSGVGMSAMGAGLGGFGLNVATSIGTGYYSQFDGSAAATYSAAAPTAAPKGTGFNQHGGAGASVNTIGGISELARPSLFDPARGALAQNFQRGGYCHEDGPCHDFIPVMPLGMVGDLLAEIANGIDTITKWWRSAGAAKGAPKPTPKFEPPTNPPQAPPSQVPEGWRVREMPATKQYPNGYWKLEKPMKDGSWQPIDPSTMKPGTRPQTHVPFPPKP